MDAAERRGGGLLDLGSSSAADGEPNALRGILLRFVWRDEGSGFGVAVLREEHTEHKWSLKGPLWGVQPGETIEVWGRTEVDPRWGRQFRVQSVQPRLAATEQGVTAWLSSAHVPGVGPVLARRIVEHLGAHALERIRQTPELLERVPGLRSKVREGLVAALGEQQAQQERQTFLLGHGIGPAMARRLVARYGHDTVRRVREDPFALAQDVVGIGFRTADRIAQALGMAREAPRRLAAGLRHAVDELALAGHTAPPRSAVIERASAALEVAPDVLLPVVQAACQAGELVEVVGEAGAGLARPDLADAEERIAECLARLGYSDVAGGDHDEARLELAQQELGFVLEGTQRRAVALALRCQVSVVTGGPGTGKTTIVKGVLAAVGPDGLRIALAAPTGRAARRLAEATGREASTVHRLLEYEPRNASYARNDQRPIEADLVLVDEASMLDAPLCAALLEALAPGTRLMLVGDADQLPSVGPGAVLDDILRAGTVPAVALDRVYRQGSNSLIVDNAHRVRCGLVPEGEARGGAGDFFVVAREHPEDILATLLDIVAERLPARFGFDPFEDIQVLAPMHRGTVGTTALNEALRERLNPHGAPLLGNFRAGDKVMQTRNNYDLELFNGDIGRIVGASPGPVSASGQRSVRVRFGDRDVDVPEDQVEMLQLAYAVTVHKSQGSEYPAVVLPLHGQQHVMLQRNLLYTAITRGRRFVVLVGQPQAVERAVANATRIRRHTSLSRRLVEQVL